MKLRFLQYVSPKEGNDLERMKVQLENQLPNMRTYNLELNISGDYHDAPPSYFHERFSN